MEKILTSSVEGTANNFDIDLINPQDLILTKKHIWVTSLTNSLLIQYTRSGQLVSKITVQSPTGMALGKSYHWKSNSRCGNKNDSKRDRCCKTKILYIASRGGIVYAYELGSSTPPVIFITASGALHGVAWLKGKLYVTAYDSGYVGVYNAKHHFQLMNNMTPQMMSQISPINNNIYQNLPMNNMSQVPLMNNMSQVPLMNNMSQVPLMNNMSQVPLINNMSQVISQVPPMNNTNLELQLTDTALFRLNYRPSGIRAIGGNIYVTFSNGSTRQGFGYVNVYEPSCDTSCSTFLNLISRSTLAMPYGLARRDDELLVGNSGSGKVTIFSFNGEFRRPITTHENGIIINDGIMGLQYCSETQRLYFVAANEGGLSGSLGYITI